MNILITGGAGFVGGSLAIHFAKIGHNVACFDNLVRRGSEYNLKRLLKNNDIHFIHGDIRNKEDFGRLKFKPDVVLECSAQTTAVDGYQNPEYDFTNNTVGLFNVLEFCRQNNSGLIFWSSNKAYSSDLCNSVPIEEKDTRLVWRDNSSFLLNGWSQNGFSEDLDINGGNHTIYGVTKNAADLLCQEWTSAFDIPVIVNRFSCLYGPHQFGKVSQGWIVWFAIAKKLNIDLFYYGFDGKQVRDYLHIDDLCNLIQKQIENISSHFGSYYNVGGGINNTTSVRELNDYLDTKMGTKSSITTLEKRTADQKIYISDIAKVSKDFSWKPKVSFDDGIDTVLSWLSRDDTDLDWVQRS